MKPDLTLEVHSFTASLANVVLPMGLTVSTVELSGEGFAFRKSPFSITTKSPSPFRATVLQDDLSAFLEKLSPAGLKKFQVQATRGMLIIDAVKPVIFDVPAKIVCTLRIEAGRLLMIVLESVEVMGAGAKNLVQSQLDKINPIIDVDQFPVEATLTGVICDEGKVVLLGTIAPKG